MAFGMFSSNPFEAFERGYGYDSFNPWTSSSERQFYRPHSRRRFLSPTFMWDIPAEMTEEEYPERKNNLSPHRRGKCKKCRPKSPRTRKCPNNSAHEDSGENSSKRRNGQDSGSPEQQMSRLHVQDFNEDEENQQTCRDEEVSRREEDNSENYESAEEPEMNEPVQEPQTTVRCADINNENPPEKEIPEVNVPEVEGADEHDDKTCEEKEHPKDEVKEKLELIEIQLKKARELVSKEDLSEPKTDKHRLYLTEMLLRCILDLDMIETRGNDTVKLSRRETVREIQSYLDQVENTSS